jgi:glycosyltransferase involved in cell wall biosynthesis
LADSLGIPPKNITWLGFVNDHDLKMCYDFSDLYVSPSRLEGFGLTVYDAIGSGKPIVATDTGAIPEIVQNYVNGLLVPRNDPNGLSIAILKILMDDELRLRLSRASQEQATASMSWQEASVATLRSYRRVVRRNQ